MGSGVTFLQRPMTLFMVLDYMEQYGDSQIGRGAGTRAAHTREGRHETCPYGGEDAVLASLERRLGNGVGGGVGRFANRPYGGMDSGSGAGMMGGVGRYEEPAPTGEGGLPWLGCEAIEVYSVEAQYVGLGAGGEGFQALSQLIDGAEHALRVGESRRPT